jgi:hypothetical protein
MSEVIHIERKNGTIIIEKDVYDRITEDGWNLGVFKKATKYGFYLNVRAQKMVNRKLFAKQLTHFIVDVPPGCHADHIDRNTLNNVRSNIRVATYAENRGNCVKREKTSSRFKGVRRHRSRWQGMIGVKNKMIHLGTFDTEIEAAQSYNQAALELFGEFAVLNDI